MATAASVGSAFEKISVHLECSICTDKYKQPKVLDCLHSFCEECLVKYRDGAYGGEPRIPCPVCRQETVLPQSGIQGLKTNFHLVGLIDEFELQEKVAFSAEAKLLCQVCDKGNEANDRCLDCEMNICLDCCKTHQQFPTLKTHKIASVDDIRQGKVSVPKQAVEYKCQDHKESVKFYCNTCEKLICQVCTVLDHYKPDHDIIDIGKTSRKYRQSLKNGFLAFEKDIKGLEISLRDVAVFEKLLNDSTTKARKGVEDRAAGVIAKVKAGEKQLLDEITTQQKEQKKRLHEHEKTLSNLLQRKKHSLETSQEVTRNASDSLFFSLHPVISKDIDKLRGQPTPKMTGLKLHPVFIKSQKLDIDLGKVVVEDMWEMCHSFGKKGSGKGEFESARGIAAAADPDEIAVTDWKNGRVVICDNQGQTKNTIPIGPNDVIAVSNLWVCADVCKVIVYRRDITYKFGFGTFSDRDKVGKTDVSLTSVAVMANGNIIVGDKKRKVLTEHNPSNGDILHTMPVKIRPTYLAVLSNGWIVISDREQGLVEVVDVSNGKAVTVTTIHPTIAGKPVQQCRGVCSNSSGIYLAVNTGYVNTGHIHHYDCACQFVSCLAQGLYSPMGITFTANGQQLAVADYYSVKMYHKV